MTHVLDPFLTCIVHASPSDNNERGRTEKLTISTRSITFLNKAHDVGAAWRP